MGKCFYNTPTYKSWTSMKERCLYPSNISYKYYGAKGITFCDRWKHFQNFLEDMGERPNNMSLDRIDNTQCYCKENCKWSNYIEQNNNRSSNVYLLFEGSKITPAQLSKKLNVPYMKVYKWIERGKTDFKKCAEHYFKDKRSKLTERNIT